MAKIDIMILTMIFVHGFETRRTTFRINIGSLFKFIKLNSGYDYGGDIGTLYTCGASVINKHYVLTAAHCVVNTEVPLR